MKDNIHIINISKGLIDTTKILKELKELDKYVDVNFTEDGMIPDYIEFDRTDKNLYITIEEILTTYVNSKMKEEMVEEEEYVKDFPNKEIKSSEDELKHIFPLLMFKKGTVKREDTVIDIERMLDYFINCNKHIVFLITNFDQYYDLLLQSYVNSLKYNYNSDKIKKLHLDAVMELEQTVLLIQEILTDSLFTYLDNMYKNMIDNTLYDDYKFDISLKFTTMKNAGEMRIYDYIKEKRMLIMEVLTLSYYKANKLLKIKNDGDDF